MLLFSDPAPFALHPGSDELPTAPLQRVSLAKLKADDSTDSGRLFEACQSVGFFAVDLLDDPEGTALIDVADGIFGLAQDFFALDADQKSKYGSPRERPLMGYKAVGIGRLDQEGTPDRVEIFGISKDDILRQSPAGTALPEPAPVVKRRSQIEDLMRRCHALTQLICLHLDRHLGLPEGTLSSRQRLEALSGNQLRMTKTAPPDERSRNVSFVPHTDIGCVTILFNVLGGLQILPRHAEPRVHDNWRNVRPEHGCVIVNLGDAMVKWTNGVLRSNMHRVAFAPGKQAELTRYSFAYFSRPESKSTMTPLGPSKLIESYADAAEDDESSNLTAAEWEIKKGIALYLNPSLLESSGGKRQK